MVKALLAHSLDPVVTTGDAELACRLTALDPERVHVEHWVSLPDLLPACDLVVAHGGAGTVLAALTAGVPLVLLPRGATSHIRTSNACRTRGAAHVIGTDPIAHADLDHALSSLITVARYRTAARELAAEIVSTPGPHQGAAHPANAGSGQGHTRSYPRLTPAPQHSTHRPQASRLPAGRQPCSRPAS